MKYILIVIILWVLYSFIFYLTHRRPLSKNEIERLSSKRKKRYILTHYTFREKTTIIDKKFKSSMKVSGKLYKTEHQLSGFPAYIAHLLKGKKHEWVILAIEGDSIIKYMWMNKGHNNMCVGFNCELEMIIDLCKENQCYTIMRFHNHPNSNPNRQTCFLASEQDKISSKYLSEISNQYGLNWLDFVCERGNYLKYFSSFSDEFIPKEARIEVIENQNNQSPSANYRLHRELGVIFR